jgi:hypothetical protein
MFARQEPRGRCFRGRSTVARAIIVTTGVVGLIGSALAADMTGADIKTFISGKTVYLETTAVSASGKAGQGVIYWAEDGTALYKTPTGAMWNGKWEGGHNLNLRRVLEYSGSASTCGLGRLRRF